MSRFSEVISNVILRNPKHVYGRIYIVSAYAGVTDLLLEHKKSKQPGVYTAFASQGPYAEALSGVKQRFFAINASMKSEGLDVVAADRFIAERVAGVQDYLNSIADLLGSGYVSRGDAVQVDALVAIFRSSRTSLAKPSANRSITSALITIQSTVMAQRRLVS